MHGTDLLLASTATISNVEPHRDIQGNSFRVSSPFLSVTLSRQKPALESLAVDSLGLGKCDVNTLHPAAASAVTFKVHTGDSGAARLEYRRPDTPDDAAPGWTVEVANRVIHLVSQHSASEKPGPIVCNFDTARCHTTLLGLLQPDGGVSLPAILHLPGHGTFRITGSGSLGYESGNGFVKVTFPAATAIKPRVEYHLEVTVISAHPWPASTKIHVSMASAATG